MEIKDFMLNFMQWYIIGCSFFCIIRILTGRYAADKLAGLNVLSALVLAFLVLRGVQQERALYLDVALVYGILGFLGFLAIDYFLKEKHSNNGEKND